MFPAGATIQSSYCYKVSVSWLGQNCGSFVQLTEPNNQAGDVGLIPGWGRSPDPLEKEMATHSSILTWEISWTEEPGGLQKSQTRLSD